MIQPDEPLDEEKFRMAWSEFAEQRKAYKAEYHLLQQIPVLKDNVAVLHLLNPVQETLLQGIQSELTDYLRKRLRNQSIQVKGELKITESTAIPYTNREKLEYLAERNPLINDLVKSLGLDPDF